MVSVQESEVQDHIGTPNTHSKKWFLGSGSTSHMFAERGRLSSVSEPSKNCAVNLAASAGAEIKGIGDDRITANDGNGARPVVSGKTPHIPGLLLLGVRFENNKYGARSYLQGKGGLLDQ